MSLSLEYGLKPDTVLYGKEDRAAYIRKTYYSVNEWRRGSRTCSTFSPSIALQPPADFCDVIIVYQCISRVLLYSSNPERALRKQKYTCLMLSDNKATTTTPEQKQLHQQQQQQQYQTNSTAAATEMAGVRFVTTPTYIPVGLLTEAGRAVTHRPPARCKGLDFHNLSLCNHGFGT